MYISFKLKPAHYLYYVEWSQIDEPEWWPLFRLITNATQDEMITFKCQNWMMPWKVLDRLWLYSLFLSIKKRLHGLAIQDMFFFYFSKTGLTTHCYFSWKRLLVGGGAVWHLAWNICTWQLVWLILSFGLKATFSFHKITTKKHWNAYFIY